MDIITMHLIFPHVTCVEVYLKIMEYLSFILFIWPYQWQPGVVEPRFDSVYHGYALY